MTGPAPVRELLDDADLRQLVAVVLDAAAGDGTEIQIQQQSEATTRFAAEGVTQNVADSSLTVTVRALVGRRSGRAATTSLDPRDLKRAAAHALAAARVAAEDPEALPLPPPQTYPGLARPALPVEEDDPAARTERVAAVLAEVRGKGLRPAGTYVVGRDLTAVANSRGLLAIHRDAQASFALTALSDSSSGWAERIAATPAGLDFEAVTATAIAKALAGRDPGDLEPGDHTVILEPAAVTDLLLFLGHLAFSGLPYNEGRSFLSGRLGESLFAERFSLRDDVHDPVTQGAPFDAEGLPRRAVTLVERGRALAVVHDRRTAAAAFTESTGHALPQPSATGPLPQNLIVAPGEASLDDLIRDTRRGVLVTRFHYTNVVDPKHLVLTGMTRDGTFRIEDGQVGRPVRNLRFTDAVPRLLAGIEELTRDRLYQSAFFEGAYVVPGLKVRALTFSSGTGF